MASRGSENEGLSSPQLLKVKLPRFLQKCAQNFESDPRYKDDLRYLRIWLQLMDFVDDPKVLLRNMERASIGTKQSLFYQAYALYYEKMKNFECAEKMYLLGAYNLVEPAGVLQKSHEQFNLRYKNKRIQVHRLGTGKHGQDKENQVDPVHARITRKNEGARKPFSIKNDALGPIGMFPEPSDTTVVDNRSHGNHESEVLDSKNENVFEEEEKSFQISISNDEKIENGRKDSIRVGEDTVFCRQFVVSTIKEEPKVENACHHGLVEPTINLKKAMDDINDMFGKPMDFVGARKKGVQEQVKKAGIGCFSILPDNDFVEDVVHSSRFLVLSDDEFEADRGQQVLEPPLNRSQKSKECDLMEPTRFTKEAMDDIGKLFVMPLDF